MAKRGDAYQEAVAEVVRRLDSTARIDVGAWIEGPDDERDLDVVVWLSTPGAPPFILIECKDWRRRVGLGVVDALESKRHDLNASFAMIFSNSGFSRGALRKAARVGILMFSALIEGDTRIRVQVEEEIYTRKFHFNPYMITWDFLVPDPQSLIPPGTSVNELIYANRSVGAWVRDKCIELISREAHSSTITAKYKFRRPVEFR